MFCVQCGQKLTEGAKFCTGCGAKVDEDPAKKTDGDEIDDDLDDDLDDELDDDLDDELDDELDDDEDDDFDEDEIDDLDDDDLDEDGLADAETDGHMTAAAAGTAAAAAAAAAAKTPSGPPQFWECVQGNGENGGYPRLNRMRYFLYTLGVTVGQVLLALLLDYLCETFGPVKPRTQLTCELIAPIWYYYHFHYPLDICRLRDMGQNQAIAAAMLVCNAVLQFFIVIEPSMISKYAHLYFRFVEYVPMLAIVYAVVQLALFLVPGTKGRNAYGKDPLQ